jgi:hypothetical protein
MTVMARVVAVVLAVVAVASHAAATPAMATTRDARPEYTVRVDLPSTRVAAGSELTGAVVVKNRTGRELTRVGCGSLFAVALANEHVQPTLAWPLCLQQLHIPAGTTRYPVTVLTRYTTCGAPATVECDATGRPPTLPPGKYRALLYRNGQVVREQRAPVVHITN